MDYAGCDKNARFINLSTHNSCRKPLGFLLAWEKQRSGFTVSISSLQLFCAVGILFSPSSSSTPAWVMRSAIFFSRSSMRLLMSSSGTVKEPTHQRPTLSPAFSGLPLPPRLKQLPSSPVSFGYRQGTQVSSLTFLSLGFSVNPRGLYIPLVRVRR